MSKNHTFVVNIKAADSIYDDNEIKQMAQNVAEALVHSSNTVGLMPETSETFTEEIEVCQNGVILSTRNLHI